MLIILPKTERVYLHTNHTSMVYTVYTRTEDVTLGACFEACRSQLQSQPDEWACTAAPTTLRMRRYRACAMHAFCQLAAVFWGALDPLQSGSWMTLCLPPRRLNFGKSQRKKERFQLSSSPEVAKAKKVTPPLNTVKSIKSTKGADASVDFSQLHAYCIL